MAEALASGVLLVDSLLLSIASLPGLAVGTCRGQSRSAREHVHVPILQAVQSRLPPPPSPRAPFQIVITGLALNVT